MPGLLIYNSLTRKKELFTPINPSEVKMYTCGPTVYHFTSIGNFRTYTSADILLRVLEYNGFKVKYIMNLTDVGHLTGDNLGDADTGEDRLEKAAKEERKTAWDIASIYTESFLTDFKKLNLTKPFEFVKATDHIQEQIDLIKKLEKKNLIYKTSDGIYFDTVKFEKNTGKKYGELSTLDQIKEGARVEPNPEKKNPRDFALWKFSPKNVKRDMEWESPWGIGFPGWHIECSAMSMKYLGETIDIHTGGEDLRSTHHPNEIAQSEGATGKQFVNYWMHGSFLKVDGKRMGKSLGNAYTIKDIDDKGFSPLDLRYFYLGGKYNEQLNFTWEGLNSAKIALEKIKNQLEIIKSNKDRNVISNEKLEKLDKYRNDFISSLNDDLNTPKALATLWEVIKSNIPSQDKYDLILDFDEVLGLDLSKQAETKEIPENIEKLIDERNKLRNEKRFEESDNIRDKIIKLGFEVKDPAKNE